MQTERIELRKLLSQLRAVGKDPPRELFDDILAYGQEAVAPLIEIVTQYPSAGLEEDERKYWATYHAIELLGELHAAEAIETILTLRNEDDDWIDDLLPKSMAQIGRPAVEPLRRALFDPTTDAYGGARVANALVQIAESAPELRDECVGILIERLDADNPRDDQYELRGFIISDLAHMRAVEALPSIQRAFDEDLVDLFVISREDVDRLIGRPEGTTAMEAMRPEIDRMTSSRGMAALEAAVSGAPVAASQQQTRTHQSLPFGRKVGRNEPCPCGSGKKYKRCHGR